MYPLADRLVKKPRPVYEEYCSEIVSSVSLCRNSKLVRAFNAVRVVKTLLFNIMHPFNYDTHKEMDKRVDNAAGLENLLISQEQKQLAPETPKKSIFFCHMNESSPKVRLVSHRPK